MPSAQTLFPHFDWNKSSAFVGPKKGNPRVARPIATKRYMHLVLKSSFMSQKKKLLSSTREHPQSFFLRGREIEKLCVRCGNLCLVEVKELALAHDHLHLIIKPKSIYAYRRFIKALSGLIARLYLKSERGPGLQATSPLYRQRQNEHFWQARPFTRIIEWGRDLSGVINYLLKNKLDHLKIPRAHSHAMIQKVLALTKQKQLVPVGFG